MEDREMRLRVDFEEFSVEKLIGRPSPARLYLWTDRNELIMDIHIQPTKAVEFTTLKFNILRTGVLD